MARGCESKTTPPCPKASARNQSDTKQFTIKDLRLKIAALQSYIERKCNHEKTCSSNRHGLRDSPWHERSRALGEPQGRQVGRRLHDAVRRQQFPHAHL